MPSPFGYYIHLFRNSVELKTNSSALGLWAKGIINQAKYLPKSIGMHASFAVINGEWC